MPRAKVESGEVPKRDEYVAPVEDGATEDLMDMRHVYLNGKKWDKTIGHQIARGILLKSPKEFVAMKNKMEMEHRVSQRVGVGGKEVVDMGSDRAEKLVRGLIEEFLKEHGK